MPRETLPSGASLLTLAGSSVARVPVPQPEPPAAEPSARRRVPATRQAASQPPGKEIAATTTLTITPAAARKQKVNARISGTLLEEVRDCVVALSGPPHGLTMDEFAEEAYRHELERMKRAHGQGKAFAKRPYNPKPGRRVA